LLNAFCLLSIGKEIANLGISKLLQEIETSTTTSAMIFGQAIQQQSQITLLQLQDPTTGYTQAIFRKLECVCFPPA
jgi:hypothetical protein